MRTCYSTVRKRQGSSGGVSAGTKWELSVDFFTMVSWLSSPGGQGLPAAHCGSEDHSGAQCSAGLLPAQE